MARDLAFGGVGHRDGELVGAAELFGHRQVPLVEPLEMRARRPHVAGREVDQLAAQAVASRAPEVLLDQARLAIEVLRALVPVLEGTAPEEVLRDFNQVLANLQLAYAAAAAEAPKP